MSKVTESSEKYLHLSFIIELRYGMDSHIIFTDVGCQTRSMEKNKPTTKAMKKAGSEYLRTFPPFQRSPSRDLKKQFKKKKEKKNWCKRAARNFARSHHLFASLMFFFSTRATDFVEMEGLLVV